MYYYITAAITSTVIPSIKVCVRACPYELINIGEQDKVFDLSENEDIHLCRYDVMRSSAPLVRQVHVVEEEDDEVPADDAQQNVRPNTYTFMYIYSMYMYTGVYSCTEQKKYTVYSVYRYYGIFSLKCQVIIIFQDSIILLAITETSDREQVHLT